MRPNLVTEAKHEAQKPLPAPLGWRCNMLEDLTQNRTDSAESCSETRELQASGYKRRTYMQQVRQQHIESTSRLTSGFKVNVTGYPE